MIRVGYSLTPLNIPKDVFHVNLFLWYLPRIFLRTRVQGSTIVLRNQYIYKTRETKPKVSFVGGRIKMSCKWKIHKM